jgi:hypothetical protein
VTYLEHLLRHSNDSLIPGYLMKAMPPAVNLEQSTQKLAVISLDTCCLSCNTLSSYLLVNPCRLDVNLNEFPYTALTCCSLQWKSELSHVGYACKGKLVPGHAMKIYRVMHNLWTLLHEMIYYVFVITEVSINIGCYSEW